MMLYSEISVNSVLKLIGVSFQLRQGVIYDENQKSVTKSIRDRISQVMLNCRNIKREPSGEERKGKEKMESDEQAIKSKWDENDKEASPLTSEAAKEKEEKENKERITDLDSSADAALTSQNILEGKSVIDHAMSRLEGIEEFSHSPHGTVDAFVVEPVTQIMDTFEKFRLIGRLCCLGMLLPFYWSNMYTYFNCEVSCRLAF